MTDIEPIKKDEDLPEGWRRISGATRIISREQGVIDMAIAILGRAIGAKITKIDIVADKDILGADQITETYELHQDMSDPVMTYKKVVK